MDPSSSSKQSSATEIREMTERKLQVTETAPTEATEHLPEDITPTKQLLAQANIPMVDKPLEQRLRRKKQPTEVTLTQSITPPTKSSVDALKAKLGSDFFKPYPEVLFALSTGAISHTGKTKKGGAPVFRLNLNDNTNYEWLFTPLGGPTYLESVCHKNCKPYPPYENGVYSDFMHMMWQRYNFIFGTNRGREIIAEWLTGEPRDTNESKAKKEMTTLMQNPTHPAPPLFHEAKQKLEKSKKLDQKENAIVTQEQSLIFPPCDHLKNPRTPMDHKVKMALIALPELSTLYKNETLKYSGYPDPIGRPVFHFTNLPEMSFVCSQNGPAESIANYKDKFLCSTLAEAIELKKNYEYAIKNQQHNPKASWTVPSISRGTYASETTSLFIAMETVYNALATVSQLSESLQLCSTNLKPQLESALFYAEVSLKHARKLLDIETKKHKLKNSFNPLFEVTITRNKTEELCPSTQLSHSLQQQRMLAKIKTSTTDFTPISTEGGAAILPIETMTISDIPWYGNLPINLILEEDRGQRKKDLRRNSPTLEYAHNLLTIYSRTMPGTRKPGPVRDQLINLLTLGRRLPCLPYVPPEEITKALAEVKEEYIRSKAQSE